MSAILEDLRIRNTILTADLGPPEALEIFVNNIVKKR
jgi:hypothetical protein